MVFFINRRRSKKGRNRHLIPLNSKKLVVLAQCPFDVYDVDFVWPAPDWRGQDKDVDLTGLPQGEGFMLGEVEGYRDRTLYWLGFPTVSHPVVVWRYRTESAYKNSAYRHATGETINRISILQKFLFPTQLGTAYQGRAPIKMAAKTIGA